jgi:predicted metal-dependent phosphoesterase TrpH
MKCDLHIHSNYSSGTQSLEDIMLEAKKKGIGLISITDDDTTAAYDELPEVAEKHGIAWLRGLQVTSMFGEMIFRFVVYGYDPTNAKLQELLTHNREEWDHMGLIIVEELEKHYPELSSKEYLEYKHPFGSGGFKYNGYLMSKGFDGSDSGTGKLIVQHREDILPRIKELEFLPINKVIEIVHKAGGKVIVQSGYLRNPETIREDLDKIVAFGADGIETYCASIKAELREVLINYAKEKNLLITGGGDGHGDFADKNTYDIGIIDIDDSLLELGGLWH